MPTIDEIMKLVDQLNSDDKAELVVAIEDSMTTDAPHDPEFLAELHSRREEMLKGENCLSWEEVKRRLGRALDRKASRG